MYLQLPIFVFFLGLDFIRAFICESDLLAEIRLDELESFSACLENGVVEFRNCRARAQRLEQLPRSDWSCIYHRGDYLPIYFEKVYD